MIGLSLSDERRLPVVGAFAFLHSTPSHFKTIFSRQYDPCEPYPPSLVGQTRCFRISDTQEFTLAGKQWCRQRDIHNSNIELLAKCNRGLSKGGRVAIERPQYLGALQAFAVYEPMFEPITLLDNGKDSNCKTGLRLAFELFFSEKLFFKIWLTTILINIF